MAKRMVITLLPTVFVTIGLKAQLNPVLKNGKYGYENEKGEIVIECKYSEAEPFYSGHYAQVKRDGKYFYVDPQGDEYLLADHLGALNDETRALVLREKNILFWPEKILEAKH